MPSLNGNNSFSKTNILFLGYDRNQSSLIEELEKYNCNVINTKDEINISDVDPFDLIISFGYRHIIKKEILRKSSIPILNLHISYLPWNRGAHPNFWSFYENTPIGVTIHLIDEGIDTGPIIYQKKLTFNNDKNTFAQTYNLLIVEIEKLFIKNIKNITEKRYISIPQGKVGTYHKASDLPKKFNGWDANIADEIKYLKQLENSGGGK